jgi:hypothetical protein
VGVQERAARQDERAEALEYRLGQMERMLAGASRAG